MKTLLFALSLAPLTASAEISFSFIEGAPKDRFVIVNNHCNLASAALTIDLTTSTAGLIFDVTAEGEGVEVFQPVEIETGSAILPVVADGAQMLDIQLGEFSIGDTLTISADLDDTLDQSDLGQIRVAGGEIEGVMVTLTTENGSAAGVLDADGNTILSGSLGCPQA